MTIPRPQGIAGEIERKKDAYRGNPQMLQQRYQQDRQFMDLLALEQLKKEKETAIRNMQLQAEQNPATIAQQREQQVLEMIKQEQGQKLGDVARRTAGTLGQINQRAQQNMQRTAQQGIASAAPRMAKEGGIIGYRSGGGVTDEEIDEYLKNNPLEASLPRQVIAGRVAAAKSDSRIKPQVELTDYAKSRLQDVQKARAQGFPEPPKEEEEKEDPKPPVDQTPFGTALAETLLEGPPDNLLDEGLAKRQTETKYRGKVEGILEGMEGELTPEKMKERREAAKEEADELLGRSTGIAKLRQQERDLEAFDKRYSDPDRLQSQALMAGLLSAGSGPLARAGAGMFNAEREQEKALRKQFKERQELGRKEIDFTRLTGAEILDEAAKVREQDRADRRSVLTTYGSLSEQEQRSLDAESNRIVDIARGNQQAKSAAENKYITMLTTLATNERRRIDALEARKQSGMFDAAKLIGEIADIRNNIKTRKQEAINDLIANDPQYAAVQAQFSEALASEDPEDMKAAEAAYAKIKAKAESDASALGVSALESSLDALEEGLQPSLQGMTSSPATTPSITASQIKSARPS